MNNKNRILYIDAIKAFAILLVVIGHVLFLSLRIDNINGSILFPTLASFHMQLFVFASGLVTNPETFKLGKRLKMLIPFFLIGTLYTYYIGHNLTEFFMDGPKYGYWYLFVLSVFLTVVWLMRYIKQPLWLKSLAVLFIFALLYIVSSESIRDLFCLMFILKLWPFFILGILARPLVKTNRKGETHIALFSLFMYLCVTFLMNRVKAVMPAFHVAQAFFAVTFVFFSFKKMEPYLSNRHNALTKTICTWGGMTMEIYTLHYFLIHQLKLEQVGRYLIEHNMVWMEFIIAPAIAAVIIFICLLAAKLIDKIGLSWIFGRESMTLHKEK